MITGNSNVRRRLLGTCLALVAGVGFGSFALSRLVTADPGQTLDVSGLIDFDQAFFAFEVEDPLESLKDTPQWNELEKLLDNPYAFTDAPDVRGNVQGWPSYIATIQRRRSFLPHGCQYNDPASGAPACDDSLLP